ncbi:MAG: type IV secretory system conjugative DNA transfer family protein [Bacilli bacterium]|nr:type IV secretory system conjugative DNA transfer family protein [Bacilli bacterium]MDD4733897.1 type IV secretory system conjugative DNA transfer family protein [Bacilli bacterium]
MKLKIRADAKDIVIFLIFCVALLYLVAIATLNLTTFSRTGTFHGFDPLPAFNKEKIAGTFVFFFFALVFIMLSVSSLFFDREKGIGISTNAKKDKGYARWATTKEMKKVLKRVDPASPTSDVAGIPLINNGKELWVDNGEFHSLIIGSTGSGKTEMLVQPLVKVLAKKGESMIITDPKGEIYENNAIELKEKGYNIVLLNFRDPQRGNSWNPLALPYSLYRNGNQDKANELLDDLAMNILYDENAQGQDPFWEKTSADYFAGLALGLFDDADEAEINLSSINLMTSAGEEKMGNTTYIKEYFSYKDPTSPAYINAVSTLMAPNETKSSILSVFKQKIKLFSSRQNLSEMLSKSDFDMKEIGRRKTAVFLVVQDEKKTYHSLVTIFIKQCYETLIDIAQESGGKLPFRTNFILDEFANMPPLKDVTTMVTAARSRKIRFNFIIQNFAQLTQVYGKENGETIKGNCGNIIYLISSEISALEEISKMCGEEKSKEKDKTVSTPLVTVSDLQRLKQWSIITIRTRMMPYKTEMTPNFKMLEKNAWGKDYIKASYPERTPGQVRYFDIKAFVDNKKEQKIKEVLGNLNPVDNASRATERQSESSKPGAFNIDELVKRIDAKIAELEEEEKRERELSSQNRNILRPTIENVEEIKSPFIEELDNEPVEIISKIEDEQINVTLPGFIEEKPKPIEIPDEENKKSDNKNLITDDQFFDDFFNDDV